MSFRPAELNTSLTSKLLEAVGSLLVVAGTVMASLGMPVMFFPFMIGNLCWMIFSGLHGFRYMFMLNMLLFLVNLFGAARTFA